MLQKRTNETSYFGFDLDFTPLLCFIQDTCYKCRVFFVIFVIWVSISDGYFWLQNFLFGTLPHPRGGYSRVERTEVVVPGVAVPFRGLKSRFGSSSQGFQPQKIYSGSFAVLFMAFSGKEYTREQCVVLELVPLKSYFLSSKFPTGTPVVVIQNAPSSPPPTFPPQLSADCIIMF